VPGFDVISDVSTTLRTVLLDALGVLNLPIDVQVHDLQNIPPNPSLLTLFLYEVVEDPSARNRPRVRGIDAGAITIAKPPMALLLRYMMTAWSNEQATQHQMIGRALQVFYDDAIWTGEELTGSMAGTTEALQFTLTPLTLDQKSWIWYAIQKPYRLSLNYEVRVVNLDSLDVSELKLVRSRTITGAPLP